MSEVASISGTSHTLANRDHGDVLLFTSNSAVTVTVPTGLRNVSGKSAFVVGIVQAGSGQVTISPAVGVTIREADSQLKTEKQWVMLTLFSISANVFLLAGRTSS